MDQWKGGLIHKENVRVLALVKACAKKKDLCTGTRLHADIVKRSLIGKIPFLASSLISMYAKCGMLVKAQNVLEDLPTRDLVSWNALIGGYTQMGQGYEALNCFEGMQNEGLTPDAVTFICILKACAIVGDMQKGKQIHDDIVNRGLLCNNVILGTALVDMYAKCGALRKAKEVLRELPARNVVSWNALISAYAQQGQDHEAIRCLECMQSEGICPDTVTFTCILKACGSIGAIDRGKQIHDEIVNRGLLQKDIMLGNALVDMYAKCAILERAHQVLKELAIQDIVSWNALISGYAQQGQSDKALNCFERMQIESITPDAITFICILKACGSIGSAYKAKHIHGRILSGGSRKTEIELGTGLIDMYAKCGMLAEAQQVLENLTSRNVICWNALIAGYAQEGQGCQAVHCFERMQNEGLSPDTVTYICILKACADIEAVDKGMQIHEKIESMGLLKKDILLGNTLLDMYAKWGMFAKAHEVLLELPVRDAVSWNVLIGGYVQHGRDREALDCFEQMQNEGLPPDAVTFSCILKVCGNTGAINKGRRIHEEIVCRRFLQKDIVLAHALVDMYAKCGELEKAKELLEVLHVQSIVSWSALIAGYVQHGQSNSALNCLEQMQKEGFCPDAITFICIAKACADAGDIEKGRKIHGDIVSRGLLEDDIVLGTALLDMYAKCKASADAENILKGLHVRDIVCWNALISGYSQHGQCHEALDCFQRMLDVSVAPDAVTLIFALNACASIGAIDKGKQIHGEIVRRSMLGEDVMLGNALVDMYAKCGVVGRAREVLEKMPVRNVVTWNALIAGYAQQGEVVETLDCFECMQNEGIHPDEVTFLGVLSACSHYGLLEEAQIHFQNMTKTYGITPSLEHHTCMLAAFGCVGHFDKAISVLEVIPCSNYPAIWLTLLGACRKWRYVKLGKLAFDQMVQLDNRYAAAYMLMADIFSAAGMLEDAKSVENLRQKYTVAKNETDHVSVNIIRNTHSIPVDHSKNFKFKACVQ